MICRINVCQSPFRLAPPVNTSFLFQTVFSKKQQWCWQYITVKWMTKWYRTRAFKRHHFRFLTRQCEKAMDLFWKRRVSTHLAVWSHFPVACTARWSDGTVPNFRGSASRKTKPVPFENAPRRFLSSGTRRPGYVTTIAQANHVNVVFSKAVTKSKINWFWF